MTSDLKKRLAIFGALSGLLLAGYLLWPSEVGKVKRCLRGAADAFARKDIIGLAGYVARDYLDASGLGYEEILMAAKGQSDRYEDIEIDFEKIDVALDGTQAKVALTVRVTAHDRQGREAASFFGDRDMTDLSIGLRKGSDGWRIASVDPVEE